MINGFKDIKSMIEYPKEGILSKVLVKDKNLNITLFCMAAGTDMSEHTSTKEGTVYILEGKGTFTLDREEIEMIPGNIIFMKNNAKHSIEAEKNTSFLLWLNNP